MKKLPEPISNHTSRFICQYNELFKDKINTENLSEIIESNPSDLNNLIMSGLGASTLLIRLGAVINLSNKIREEDFDEDALLVKRIIDNLKEILPTDTNWKNIWQITCKQGSEWSKFTDSKKGEHSIIERFVIFRNKFVHGYISLKVENVQKLLSGLDVIYSLCTKVSILFQDSELKELNGKFYFVTKENKTELYPFVQKGSQDGLPYIFQGIKKKNNTAELINSFYGNIESQNDDYHYKSFFNPMVKLLEGGTGKVFDHESRIDYYNECFVGRIKETVEVLDWVISGNDKTILPVYSSAGMGKGAFMAKIISELKNDSIPVLYHFCDSGLANNLHAILYHLILQGKNMQIWNDELIANKKRYKLPTKYEDLISLFQKLVENNFVIHKKNSAGNLVIIIDGLDQAFVSYPNYNIGDYFNLYDDNGNIIGIKNYKNNIKWIFTFREGYYKLPDLENKYDLKIVQPLNGLDENSIIDALIKFKPSRQFIDSVIEKGKVI